MMMKLCESKAAAGRGIANMFLSVLDTNREIRETEIKASQMAGAKTMKTLNKDNEMSASPIWVRLCWISGYRANAELR